MLVGDGAYPLKNWLIKPFSNRGHLCHEISSRESVRLAKRSLEGFTKKNWTKSHVSAKNRDSRVLLHNFCLVHGDAFDDDENRAHLMTLTLTTTTTRRTQLTMHALVKLSQTFFSYPRNFVSQWLIYQYILLFLKGWTEDRLRIHLSSVHIVYF